MDPIEAGRPCRPGYVSQPPEGYRTLEAGKRTEYAQIGTSSYQLPAEAMHGMTRKATRSLIVTGYNQDLQRHRRTQPAFCPRPDRKSGRFTGSSSLADPVA